MPRDLLALKNKIIRLRAKSPKVHYSEICRRLAIFKDDGAPDTGLAKLIENGYEPRTEALRSRLGLGAVKICPHCHRRISRPQHHHDGDYYADDAMRWWRNVLTPEQRRGYIQKIYQERRLS